MVLNEKRKSWKDRPIVGRDYWYPWVLGFSASFSLRRCLWGCMLDSMLYVCLKTPTKPWHQLSFLPIRDWSLNTALFESTSGRCSAGQFLSVLEQRQQQTSVAALFGTTAKDWMLKAVQSFQNKAAYTGVRAHFWTGVSPVTCSMYSLSQESCLFFYPELWSTWTVSWTHEYTTVALFSFYTQPPAFIPEFFSSIQHVSV